MQLDSLFKKTQFWFTQLGFLVLGILAFTFADERLLADSSYYFIRVINSEGFWVEHNRLILGLSQVPVVVGSLIGMSMKGLIIAYSIWHVLFFYAIHLLAKHHYSSKISGPVLLLLMSIGLTSGFFVPMFELYYAAALIVLFDAILSSGKVRIAEHFILFFLALFIASAHFMAVALLGIILIFQLLNDLRNTWKRVVLPLVTVASVMGYKKSHISDYEQGKIDWFINGLQNFSITTQYLNDLGNFLVMHYLDFLFILTLAIISLISEKKWKETLVFLVALSTLTIMVTVSEPWFEHNRYQEQVYYPLMFIAVFFLVKNAFQSTNNWIRTTAFIVAIGCFGHRASDIWSQGKVFNSRLNELRNLIAETQDISGTKFVVSEGVLTYEPNWSYPIESLIFSSAEFEKTVTICTDVDYNHNENSEVIQPHEFLFRRWEINDVHELNANYFSIDDSKYQLLR